MRDGKMILIDFENNPELSMLAKQYKINYINLNAKETLGLKTLIVRPDGIVAWLAEDKVDLESAKTALSVWHGQ